MLGAVLVSLRPRQWVKNLFVFAGLVFGQRLFTPAVWPALGAFAIFCGLSGAVYLVNDVADRDQDRLHPKKRERPVAAGRLPIRVALGVAIALVAAGLVAAARISTSFLLVAVAYVVLLTAYSTWLKHIVIVDVLTVAVGFVLRALAGTLALGKRRHEYLALGAEAARHRPILAEYNAGLLDQMIAVVTASTVTAYALYTMSPETVAKFHTQLLPATLPFVLYGIFRYLYLLYSRQLGGNPSELFLNDRALILNTACWIAAVLLIIYGTRAQ